MMIVLTFFIFTLWSEVLNISGDLNISVPEVKLSNLYDYAYFSNDTEISRILISKIDGVLTTLDIAIYSFNNTDVCDAILRAYERGVKTRIVIEYSKIYGSKIEPAVQKLIDRKVPIKALRGSGRYGVMHNKFVIFDGRLLMTGSYNFTVAADKNNFENVVFVRDEKDISSYSDYFNKMWNSAIDVYSTSKNSNLYTDFSTSLFTMIDGIRKTIINLIDNSVKNIDICVYSISDDEVYESLKRAKSKGVAVRIVTDRLQSTQSQTLKKLIKDGFDIKVSNGYNNGVMHNKFALFDDRLVVTGSFNWSNNAENYNWENLIILSEPYISLFKNNFEYIYSKAWEMTVEDTGSLSNSYSISD